MAASILIVDDHEVLRNGVRAIISSSSVGEVCGEAANGEDAIRKVRELKPDLVILDISMPGMNGLEAARQIRQIAPAIKILIFTMHNSPQTATAALDAGADAVVVKAEASNRLTEAVKQLLRQQ